MQQKSPEQMTLEGLNLYSAASVMRQACLLPGSTRHQLQVLALERGKDERPGVCLLQTLQVGVLWAVNSGTLKLS